MTQWSWALTKRLLVQTSLWSLNVVCCAFRKGALSTSSQSTLLELAYAGSKPAGDWCPIQVESMTLICLAPQKQKISTGLMLFHGTEKDLGFFN